MSKDNNRDIEPTDGTLLTAWWFTLPAWLTSVTAIACLYCLGLFVNFTASNLILVMTALTVLMMGWDWHRGRWIARERLAQRALSLLKQTPEGQKRPVRNEMKSALMNQQFMAELKQCLVESEWKIQDTDVTVGRWEISFPLSWRGTSWSWCAFGLLSAARPYDVACLSAKRTERRIILDLASEPEILNGMIRWDRELSEALGAPDHPVLVQVARFELIESEKVSLLKEETHPPLPWMESILLVPEGVRLDLSYDGLVYRATTTLGLATQTSEYKTWIKMWETWHHFEDADAAMSRHIVT